MNRRNFFTLGAPPSSRAAGNHGPHLRDAAQNPPAYERRTLAGLEPLDLDRDPWDYAKAAHLARRCMVGPTEAEIRQLHSDGLEAALATLFEGFIVPTDEISAWAGQDPQVRPESTDDLQTFQAAVQQKKEQLVRWWLHVITTSRLSIQERMTLFWHNHFTSELQTVQYAEFMWAQNQLLRVRGLGNFKQFVKDVTKDMAMLIYLDGAKSFKTGNRSSINENYARELMELFTMGVVDWSDQPNYTQADVTEAARALSGYSVTTSSKGATYLGLASQFVPTRWDSGSKTILGKTGAWKADDVVEIIFSERADQTAKFICEKLYRAFVYDVPDRTIVAAMAETLRGNNWELTPVVRQLLRSAHFFDPTNIGALDKSPVDYMLGLIRSLGLTSVPDFNPALPARQTRDLMTRMSTLGQTLFDPPNVKGWPGGRTWISTSTLPVRQKFALDVMDAKLKAPGQNGATYYLFDPIAFARMFPSPDNIQALSADMARFLLPAPPSAKESKMLLDTIMDGGASYDWDLDDPSYKAAERIRKYLKALFQLAKFQLH